MVGFSEIGVEVQLAWRSSDRDSYVVKENLDVVGEGKNASGSRGERARVSVRRCGRRERRWGSGEVSMQCKSTRRGAGGG